VGVKPAGNVGVITDGVVCSQGQDVRPPSRALLGKDQLTGPVPMTDWKLEHQEYSKRFDTVAAVPSHEVFPRNWHV
jgi:hypothetical protein